MSRASRFRPEPSAPLRLAAAVALVVTAVDLGSKIAAAALLQGGEIALRGGLFLSVIYNDTFARGVELGGLTLPATIAVALLVLGLAAWIGTALARIDRDAPLALGLIAGATIANAADYLRTGRGVVDFLGFDAGAGSAIVFNLADVAAYVGVILLARTSLRLCAAIVAERRSVRVYEGRRITAELPIERPLPVSVVMEGPTIRRADSAPSAHDDGLLDLPETSAARTARGIETARPAAGMEHGLER